MKINLCDHFYGNFFLQQSTSNSIVWWQYEDLPGNDSSRKHLYITDENGQSLYFYVWCGPKQECQFLLGNKHDKKVAAADIFQIIIKK